MKAEAKEERGTVMKIINKKHMAALAAGCLLCSLSAVSGVSSAAEQAVLAGDAAAVTMQVKIVGHETGTIYRVTDAAGHELRMDLGKHGGRMLNKHPFIVKGQVMEDEKGQLIKMEKVEYKDPAVQIEKAAQRAGDGTEENLVNIHEGRDAAYAHALSQSHNAYYYTYNMTNVQDTSQYKPVAVTEIAQQPAGTKIAFTGSAVATVQKDEIMRFWGGPKAGGHVDVVMNGAYVPLGQRSTVYGTLNEDGAVVLELLESVE